ncbi:hypothetical protein CBW65_18970 [Tumebacillus avium]|uniref:DUF3887 domain-containing protein n=1 Tax=Tumebacillus avium TaxID=1903704 RepID=A0A1Y0IQD4_9BACL|nr:hypothetical protein [Tumebacillus avium]ARU62822.1 hypothetical protein CBW65_18970 [Tumebacillus avium]
MKTGFTAGLLLASLLFLGCGQTVEQRQYLAISVAKDFSMAVLDYQHRTSNDDIKGLEFATESAQEIVKQQLKTPDEVRQLKGDKEMPEVVNVAILEATPIDKDGETGFIVNARIQYYPNVYHYVDILGLKVVPIGGGEWEVDDVKFGEEL